VTEGGDEGGLDAGGEGSGLTVFGSGFFCCVLWDGGGAPDLVDVDGGPLPDLVEVDEPGGTFGDFPPWLLVLDVDFDEVGPVGVTPDLPPPGGTVLPPDVVEPPGLGDFAALLGEVDLEGFLAGFF